MNSLLIHGCYDPETLKTLKDLKVKEFAFDLRARSLNFIPLKILKSLLNLLIDEKIYLVFENDTHPTITSTLEILKQEGKSVTGIFRDFQPGEFYHKIEIPFLWMFHPAGDWKSILAAKKIQGILLPLKWQDDYHKYPDLWKLIEEKHLEVYLHAENFEEALTPNVDLGLNLSVDLSQEVETQYRVIDQNKLKEMKIWRKLNESPALK